MIVLPRVSLVLRRPLARGLLVLRSVWLVLRGLAPAAVEQVKHEVEQATHACVALGKRWLPGFPHGPSDPGRAGGRSLCRASTGEALRRPEAHPVPPHVLKASLWPCSGDLLPGHGLLVLPCVLLVLRRILLVLRGAPRGAPCGDPFAAHVFGYLYVGAAPVLLVLRGVSLVLPVAQLSVFL